MSPADILRRVRDLLADPARWAQAIDDPTDEYGHAADAAGRGCLCNSPHAVKWTALGALWSVTAPGHPAVRSAASLYDDGTAARFWSDAIGMRLGHVPIAQWHQASGRTHAEVLAALDAAIASAEADKEDVMPLDYVLTHGLRVS